MARDAARYPPKLVKAIIRGMTDHLKHIGVLQNGAKGLMALDDEKVLENLIRSPERGYSGKYKDSISGQVLQDELVLEARRKEMEYFTAKGVWCKRPRQEAYTLTGRPPISTKWVDVNKGDDDTPRYRSRLVARQLKATDKSGQSYFAPTPPLESLRTVLSLAATTIGSWKPCREPKSEERTQVSFLDISRAYFNARTDEDQVTYVQLPAEDPDCGVLCARLLRHMYGTRAAADGWQEEYSTTLVDVLGFVQGNSSP